MKRKQLIERAREEFLESDAVAAGRLAEAQVARLIEQSFKKLKIRGHVWHDIRVPRLDSYGKYEIDFLVLSAYGALVIEVKNFGGSLEVDPSSGRWIQTTRSAQKKIHECPLDLTAKKKAALLAFLAYRGTELEAESFQVRVVLANPQVGLSTRMSRDERIRNLSSIVSCLQLLAPRKRGFLGFGRTPVVLSRLAVLVQEIDRLPTWDEIELHGGKILRGDIHREGRGQTPSRGETREVRLCVPRHRFWGWLHPSFYFYQIREKRWLAWRWQRIRSNEESIRIKLAGDQSVTEIEFYHIKKIRYGWRDESYYSKKV